MNWINWRHPWHQLTAPKGAAATRLGTTGLGEELDDAVARKKNKTKQKQKSFSAKKALVTPDILQRLEKNVIKQSNNSSNYLASQI